MLVDVKSSGEKTLRYGSGSSRSIGRWDGRGASGSSDGGDFDGCTVRCLENGRKLQRTLNIEGGCGGGSFGSSVSSFARIELS